MKNYIILLIAGIFFGACKKESLNIEFDVWGTKNADEWRAISNCNSTNNDTIHFKVRAYNNFNELRESLILNNVPLKQGLYNISRYIYLGKKTSSNYFTLISDGDVLDGIFFICEDEDNYIEIQEVNKSKKYISGKFQITFIQDTISKPYKPYLPDTIRFENVNFSTYYK